MSWLDEPAFAAERAPIARWAISVSLGATGAGGPPAGIEVLNGEGLELRELDGVTIAAAGISPRSCLEELRTLLAVERPRSPSLHALERLSEHRSGASPADSSAARAWVALLPNEGTVIAYRDPLGRIPLFWRRGGDRLLLSADSERIVEHAGAGRPNAGTLIGQLSSLWGPIEETYLEGIRRVPPGRALIAGADGRRLVRHWDPIGEMDPGSEPLDRDRFRSLLAGSVAREAGSARAAIYLSGGLDSVAIAALARSHADASGQTNPYALSVDFSGSDFDESRTQVAVARSLELEQTLKAHAELCAGDPLQAALELASTMPAPPQNFFLPGFITLGHEGAERRCASILTGTGGDEWLGVTPALAADLIARRRWRDLLDLYRTVHRSNPLRHRQVARAILWRFGVRALLGTRVAASPKPSIRRLGRRVAHRHRRAIPGWIAPGAAGAAELDRRFAALVERRPVDPRSHYATEVRNGFDHPVATTEAEEHVEQGRRAGIPLRHPFLDPELVRLLCAARVEDLNDGRRSKGPLRALVARELPGLGFETQKKPIAAGYVSGLVGASGPTAYQRLGGPRALAELGVVDPRGVARLVEAVRAGSDRLAPYRLWEILCLEAWARPRT